MTTTVRDNPEQRRYEIHDGQTPAGFSAHRTTGRKNAFPPTEPLPEFSGCGPVRQPVAAEPEDARIRDPAVLPFRPCVRKTTAQDPEAYGGPRTRGRTAPLRSPRDGDDVATTRRRSNHSPPGASAVRDPRCGRRPALHHRSGGAYGGSGTARWQR
ncbi:hypothetical protein DIZ27_22145 [Streptomyces sp. NWU339]|uniref:hypothetical protein n=1 Tax=Streptomyces sp. NWU339 TaxID=2185284 RepID=UPI000D6740E8|nr:hypothetical protein [Streptomyces sp. NWU339]PWI08594.1 hypothetical protein DIZ27_22145 [Streptomyces sp. NWU339]